MSQQNKPAKVPESDDLFTNDIPDTETAVNDRTSAENVGLDAIMIQALMEMYDGQ